jgi:Putative peptidoglycan binding domain
MSLVKFLRLSLIAIAPLLALDLPADAQTPARQNPQRQQARPEAVDPARMAAAQRTLILAGDAEVTLSGRLDAPTQAALRRFQTGAGLAASGLLDEVTANALTGTYAKQDARLGLSIWVEPDTGFLVPVPHSALPAREATDLGERFAAADGTVTLETAVYPGKRTSLAQFRADISKGKTATFARLDQGGLFLVLRDGERVETWRAVTINGQIAAAMLAHPVTAAETWRGYARLLDQTVGTAGAQAVPTAAAPVEGIAALPGEEAGLTVAAQPADTATARRGSVSAILRLARDPLDARGRPGRPVVDIVVEETKVLTFDIEDRAEDWTQARIRIAELDGKADRPEVMLSVVASPDECCTLTFIFAGEAGGRWRMVESGPFLSMPRLFADPARAGTLVIGGELSAFHRAFGATRGSQAPLSLHRLADGAFVDATREPPLAALQRRHLDDLFGRSRTLGFRPNGIWPGLVASARVAGEGDAVTALMRRLHDRNDLTGRVICRERLPVEQCPPADRVTRSFPDALEAFLREAGF